MLLMVVKGIRGGICLAIHRNAKASNKYMKDYDKNKESSYLRYWDANRLYGWAISSKLRANEFEEIDTSPFNEDFIKTIMRNVTKDIFSKLMFSTMKN